MQVTWISVLALLLVISSIQWGVSTGEELNEKAPHNRPRRQTSSYSYVAVYVYCLIGLCVCISPCIIIGIIICIAVCVTSAATSHRNAPAYTTTTQIVPPPQPYNYAYPQPVQTQGYYPPGPPATVKAPIDTQPPPYHTTQQGNPQPNIGFQI